MPIDNSDLSKLVKEQIVKEKIIKEQMAAAVPAVQPAVPTPAAAPLTVS